MSKNCRIQQKWLGELVASWACEVNESSHKELMKLLLCEDYNDLTSATSNQIPKLHIAVSVVYETFLEFFFEHSCSYCLILPFNCEIKLSELLL